LRTRRISVGFSCGKFVGKPRHIVSPRVVEVVVQEHGWKQAECEWGARGEPLDDLPGALIFFVRVGANEIGIELVGVSLGEEIGAAGEILQIEELIFFETMNGFDIALVGMRGWGDAHVLAVAESFGEGSFELAAVIGLPDQVTKRNAVVV
jgi:hypothetical protein